MKKLNVLFLALGFAFMLNSCSKSEEIQNVALAQTINQNQSYTFELPVTDDPYKVTTEAKNASISLIGIGTNGNPVYNYTPNLDFVGTDQIVLTTEDHKEKSGKRGHHGKKGSHYDNYNVNGKGKGMCGDKDKDKDKDDDDDDDDDDHNENNNHNDDYMVTINITVLPVVPKL